MKAISDHSDPLFEKHPYPMWAAHSDGRMISANEMARTFYGYSIEEIPNLHAGDINLAMHANVVRKLQRHVKKNGSVVEVEVSVCSADFLEFGAKIISMTDVTAQQNTLRNLGKDDALMSSVVQALEEGLVAVDQQGHLTLFNASFSAMAKTLDHDTPTEGLRLLKSLLSENGEVIPTDHQPLTAALAGRAVATEALLQQHDGQFVPVSVHARPIWSAGGQMDGAVMVLRDLSEIKASEKKYQDLFDNSVEGLFQTSLDGKFVMANPACAKILGYQNAKDLIGQGAPLTTDFYFEKVDRAGLLDQLRAYGVVHNQHLKLKKADGTPIWVHENVRALYDEDGVLTGMEGTIEDVTHEREVQLIQKISEERFERAVRGSLDGVWDWNVATGEFYMSDRWKAQLGYDACELLPSIDEWLNRVHPDDRHGVEQSIEAHRTGRLASVEIEHRVRHKDGQYRWILTRGVSSLSAIEEEHLAGSQTDISHRKRAEERLQHDALHDNLTQLPNRGLMMDRLDQALRQLRRFPDHTFAILYLDLDRFKIVNDTLGHAVGDELLIEVAKTWSGLIREYDTLARMGGDEFVLLLEHVTSLPQAEEKARALLKSVEAPLKVAGHNVSVGSSIGVCWVNSADQTASDVLRNADMAMYQAKIAGRNCMVVFEEGMKNNDLRTFQMEHDLRAAIGSEQMQLFYQPIARLEDMSVGGYEALLRWHHPDRGVIQPMEFIPLARETGLIVAIDLDVLRQACRHLVEWTRDGKCADDVTMSVNVSSEQLGRLGFPEEVKNILASENLDPKRLKIEITENAVIDHPNTAGAMIEELQRMGVGVILDDFGTGFSSLSHLYRFPFDGIKVDQHFFHQISEKRNVTDVMDLIRVLGEKMCITVVPEGIETLEQLQRLKGFGFVHAQGYLLGRPQSASDLHLPPEPKD